MRTARTIAGARAGLTLIELAIAALVLVVVLGAMVRALSSGSSAFQEGSDAAEVDAVAQRLIDRVADELRGADFTTLVPAAAAPFGASTLSYACGEGWAAGSLVHGPTRTLRTVLDSGEIDNGLDDNGNGLVDEQRVELVPDAGAPGTVIALGRYVREFAVGELANGVDDNGDGWIDERGLSFLSDGTSTITVRLTIERPTRGGRTVARALETTVRLRNH